MLFPAGSVMNYLLLFGLDFYYFVILKLKLLAYMCIRHNGDGAT